MKVCKRSELNLNDEVSFLRYPPKNLIYLLLYATVSARNSEPPLSIFEIAWTGLVRSFLLISSFRPSFCQISLLFVLYPTN